MKGIKENDALLTLMQMYQSRMSMLNSTCITLAVGAVVIPLFALTSSLNLSPEIFGLKERFICFIFTLGLALTGVYYVHKTIFIRALMWQTLIRLDVMDKGKSLLEYYDEMKVELRNKYPAFRKYNIITHTKETTLEHSYNKQDRGFVAGSIVLTLILFSFIWWGTGHFFWYLLGSELIYGLLNWPLFRFVRIM